MHIYKQHNFNARPNVNTVPAKSFGNGKVNERLYERDLYIQTVTSQCKGLSLVKTFVVFLIGFAIIRYLCCPI